MIKHFLRTKWLFVTLFFALGLTNVNAAVSSGYAFSQTSTTWTPITGGTLLGSTTSDDQRFINPSTPAGGTATTGPGFYIGFPFVFDGNVFSRVAINNNGWISFGDSTLATPCNNASTSAYLPLSSASAITPNRLRNRIAAMGVDLQGQTGSSLRIQTLGTAPNRYCVIQWLNYRGYLLTGHSLNFQIVLYETSNLVEIIYGPQTFNTTSITAHVGLGGSVATDFNNRLTTSNWNTTTAGTANTSSCTILNTVTVPSSGTVFRWSPVACPVPNLTSVTYDGTNFTANWSSVAGSTGYNLQYRLVGAGAFTSGGSTTSTSRTLSLPCGNYEFRVQNDCGSGSLSPFSSSFTYTIPSPTITTIGNPSASTSYTVNWTSTLGTLNYEIEYAPYGTSSWTSLGSTFTGTSATVTLPSYANYSFRVRSNCGGFNSAYSPVVNFTRPPFNVTRTTGITYTSLRGTTGTPCFSGATSGDDATSGVINIPFTFNYFGRNYTSFRVCTNGWLSLNPSVSSTTWTNNMATGTNATLNTMIAPMWEDLTTGNNLASETNTDVVYEISGTAPNRVVTIEWYEFTRFAQPSPSLNFQVKLYETSNIVEFLYGNMIGYNGSVAVSYDYTCGLSDSAYGTITSTPSLWTMQDENTNWFSNSGKDNLSMMPTCFSKLTFDPSAGYSGGTAYPNPSNDNVAGAILLPTNTTPCTDFCSGVYRTKGATATGSPAVCTGTADDDIWFRFVTIGDTSNVSLISSQGFQGVIQILDSALNTLPVPVCVTGTAGTQTLAKFPTNAGATYYIRVYHTGVGTSSSANGTGTFNICAYGQPTPPVNDNCVGATNIVPGTSCVPISFNTATATASSEASCGGTPDDDIWFKFTATRPIYICNVQSLSGFNAHVQVFNGGVSPGDCATKTSIQCVNVTGFAGLESVSLTGLTVGNVYYVRVYNTGTGFGTGNGTICIYDPVPANDSCSTAIPVTCGGTYTGNTSFATADVTEFVYAGAGTVGGTQTGVWYEYAGTNQRVTLSTCTGSAYNTRISVYSGLCGSGTLIPVAGNDDACGTQSTVNFNAYTGTTYKIFVHGNAATGAFTLNVTCNPLCTIPANDLCSGAVSLVRNSYGSCASTTVGTTTCANADILPVPTFGGWSTSTSYPDVWYSFVAPSTGAVVLRIDSVTAPSVGFTLYDSCGRTTGILSTATVGFGFDYTLTPLTSGATYYIRVATTTANMGSFRLCLQGPPPPPSNDNCNTAIPISVDSACVFTRGTVGGATSSGISITPCAGAANNDVWYRFLAPRSGVTITVNPVTAGVDFDAQVFRGGCPTSLIHHRCVTTFPTTVDTLSTGTYYYVRVYNPTSVPAITAAAFDICIQRPGSVPLESEDDMCFALDTRTRMDWSNWMSDRMDNHINPNSDTIISSNTNALREFGEPIATCGSSGALPRTVWYRVITPSCAVQNVVISTDAPPTAFDTRLAIFDRATLTDCRSTMTQRACNDDAGTFYGLASKVNILAPGFTGTLPGASFTGSPGRDYFVQMSGYSGSSGNFGFYVDANARDITVSSPTTTTATVQVPSYYDLSYSGTAAYMGTSLRYQRNGTVGYVQRALSSADTITNMNFLIPNTLYNVWAAYRCQDGIWCSQRRQVTTLPACSITGPIPAPTVTPVAGHCARAVVSWSPVTGASRYRVYWRRVGSSGLSWQNVNASPYTVYLPLNDNFDIWVQALCDSPGPTQSLNSAITNYTTCAGPARMMKDEPSVYEYNDLNFVNMSFDEISYYIQDADKPGVNTIELKEIPRDEFVNRAPLVDPLTGAMNIYPNPAESKATVSYVLPMKSDKLTIKLLDMQGKIQMQRDITQPDLFGNVEFDISKLVGGMYLVKIESDVYQSTKKLVVER